MITDDFIEMVITPEREYTNRENTMEIAREFYGMEEVASFKEEDDQIEAGEDNNR
jgi:hypothetical protein